MASKYIKPDKEIILVTIPSINKPGGVGNYYKIFKKYSGHYFHFLQVGQRKVNSNFISEFIRLLLDFINISRKILGSKCKLIILNPSFEPKSLFRDGIYLLAAKIFNRKAIIFFRGWHNKWEHLFLKKFGWLFKLIFYRADAIIVLALEFKMKLQEHGYPKPIFVETTIVDQSIFSESQSEKLNMDDERKKTDFNILFLSRIEKEKGIYEALDTYKILKLDYSKITLSIAGDGDEKKEAMQYVRNNRIEDVTFLGYIRGNDKSQAFRKSDVYLFPTYYGEGMPNSLLEAMAYSLPVITRPVGGIKDFFENGKMGFISDSLKPEDYASFLETLIINPGLRKRIGDYNKKFAFEKFSSLKVIQRVEEICEIVINNL